MEDSKKVYIVFGSAARKQLFAGLKLAAEAVTSTMGPHGRTVLIQNGNALPILTKDGVTVSKAINLKDPIENMGAQLICEAAAKTNENVGDGTTCTSLITYALIAEGIKLVEANHSPVDIINGAEKAVNQLIEILKTQAKPINNKNEMVQIATISANGDKTIGNLIADAIEAVGRDGIVTVENGKETQTSLEILEGTEIERGYMSPYFITDQQKMHARYENAKVLICENKITNFRDLVPLLESIRIQNNAPLLIVAEDYDPECLQVLTLNKLQGGLKVVAIKAPGFGTIKESLLQDLAMLVNTKVVSPKTGISLDKFSYKDLGHADVIVSDRNKTTIVCKNNTESLKSYVDGLREQMTKDVTLADDDKAILKKRIAKLSSGVGVIRVGGSTELEMQERKYRIEDALNATLAAIDEGIVPGGGVALIDAQYKLDSTVVTNSKEMYGFELVRKICFEPLKRIVKNCSGESPEVICEKIKEHKKTHNDFYGYNAANGKFMDLLEAGVIDPVKVTRSALQNALSVAAAFFSLNAIISEAQ